MCVRGEISKNKRLRVQEGGEAWRHGFGFRRSYQSGYGSAVKIRVTREFFHFRFSKHTVTCNCGPSSSPHIEKCFCVQSEDRPPPPTLMSFPSHLPGGFPSLLPALLYQQTFWLPSISFNHFNTTSPFQLPYFLLHRRTS
ncbi:hypothetical protein PAL_GLEAN10022977 [Pteropus alecto]|uniref:Uncharacterized protein n=1 Tax=Pteropus alecto TaxID=9402 RepID=L5K4Y7_PTEAL|nr:hypothetical protein PAL_GLEAN10022977 [Pteropus alecto]